MRTGVATILLALLLAAPAAAKPRLRAIRLPGNRVTVDLSGVRHVKRVIVRWGDGTRTTRTVHSYKKPGIYTIIARAERRGRRRGRTARNRILVPGPVAAHHFSGYLVSDQLQCGGVSLETGVETSTCGTSLSVDGVLYQPSEYVPVTSYQSGAGTALEPYVLTRVVRAGGRVELLQTTRYVVGGDTVSDDYSLRTVDGQQHIAVLYRTVGCPKARVGSLAKSGAGCTRPAAPTSTGTTLFDRGQGGHVQEGTAPELAKVMTAGDDFTDFARRGRHAATLGVSWRVTLPAISAATVLQASQLQLSFG